MEETIDWDNSDILLRLSNITKSKLSYANEYPHMVSFADQFIDLLFTSEKKIQLNEWRKKVYSHNIDETLFRDGISYKEVLQISRWTLKGLYLDALAIKGDMLDEDDIVEIQKSCDHYYEKLKLALYK